MGKILVFIYNNMADFEVSLLLHLLSADCGKKLLIASNSMEIVTSKSGVSYMPQIDLKNINTKEIDGIIIPGGWLLNLDDRLIEIIKELNSEHKLIAAICAAPWILAKAGILDGCRYTTSIEEWQDIHSEIYKIENPFPQEGYVNLRIVRDSNIITAKGMAFIEFAIEVCDYFGAFKDEKEKKEFEKEIKGC